MPLPNVLAAIESMLLLAPLLLEDSQYPDIATIIQQLSGGIAANATQFVMALDSAAIRLARLAYVAAFLIGALLYFTQLHKNLGRDMVTGGLFLAVLSEFILPAIIKL